MEPGTALQNTDQHRWRLFVRSFGAAIFVLGCAAVAFIGLLDPFGLRAAPGRAPGPLMDGNQRFMYPQVVRSGAYDAAVFGTSTSRLIDPRDLDKAFGAHFANLSMNAATAYEQTRLAQLFLSETAPKAVLFGIDTNVWCAADADQRRLTFRPFPPWLYEPDPSRAILRQVNWQSLTTASRVLLYRLGLAKERIRGDGFAVFTPPEASYDAARARAHIHGGLSSQDEGEPAADFQVKADAPDAPMPALTWLDELLASLPPGTKKLVAFMPVHVAEQGAPGTPRGLREAACKAEVARIGKAHGATVVDFRIPSPVTTQDQNYWDRLHYRLPIAGRIVAGLLAASETGRDDPGGLYRVLMHP